MVALKSQKRAIDKPLLALCLGLVFFGLLAVFDVSGAAAHRDFSDKFYYLKLQAIWVAVGLAAMLFLARIDYHFLIKISPLLMLAAVAFLGVVLLPGIGIKVLGARRWLGIGPIGFQPAELTKLALVIYLSSILAKRKNFLQLLVILFILTMLIMAEPDLGTTVVILGIGTSLFFVAGGSILQFLALFILLAVAGVALVITSAYRRQRLLTFFSPATDPLGASYHLRQVLLALGSGGLFGLGAGQSRQKFEYLPEATTDSIFAVVAEELGFLGSLVLICVIFLVVVRIWQIAKTAPDGAGRLMAAGIGSWIAIQTIINLGAMTATLPLTGVPLPFISYGGSSLVLLLAGIGIVLNISWQTIKHK